MLSTDLDHTELPNTIRQMAKIVGWKVWRNRIKTLESELQSNPLWRSFLLEHHGLEMAFGDVRRHLKTTNRLPWPPRTAEEYRLYSFLAMVTQVHAKLSPSGQKKLAGALRSGLKKEFGLGPLAFEMKIVAHLISRGFSVEFHDLEGNGGYDFLADIGSTKIEVECKHISADIGRKIPRRSLYDLGGVLFPATKKAVDDGNGGRLIHVTLPDRLTSNKGNQKKIAEHINAILSGKSVPIDNSCRIVSERPFDLDNSPFSSNRGHNLTMEDVQNYLKRDFGIENANVLLNWRPGHAAVVIWFQSTKPDTVLHNILKNLKNDANRQFSGDRPAFLCVHFADITQEQLLDLANTEQAGTETGLQRMSSILLQKRPHLHTVAMMTDGEVKITKESSTESVRTSIQETGPSYVYQNPNHPLANSTDLDRVFV